MVGVSSSGVPLVNIVAPNRAGVSLNNFTHYNVGTKGAVIVNTPRSTQTQIAGWVQGNPLMGNAPARVIINQVTSGNPTRLLGMTEIAGNRANLVIANPAGIACAGCGFINVPRVSLATGRTRLNADGSLAGFDVTRGRLSVGGGGLDARGNVVDLIARAMRINAQIWADSVHAVAGANQVGYADGIVVRQAGEGERPTVAIDVHALGSMYANSVFLIGTEAGVGVRHSGELDSLTGTIEVSANGDVTIEPAGRIQAAGSIRIDAPTIKNEGTITSLQTARLSAVDTLRNDGVVAARSNADLSARDLTSRGVVMAGVNGRDLPSGPGSVTLTGERIASSGSLAAGDNVNVSGTSVSLDGSQVFAASALNVAGEQSISMRAITAAALNATLRSHGVFVNDAGALDAVAKASINARSVSNRSGVIQSGDAAKLDMQGGLFDNRAAEGSQAGGRVIGKGVTLAAGALENAGGVISSSHTTAVSAQSVTNDRGVILSHEALTLEGAGDISNIAGQIAGDADVTIAGAAIDNTRGAMHAGHDLEARAQGNVDNGGAMTAGNVASVSGERIDNQAGGDIAGTQGTRVLARQSLSNEGLIDGGATRVEAAETVANHGRIYGDSVSIGGQLMRNQANAQGVGGVIASRGDVDIGATVIENRSESLIYASNDLRAGRSLDADGRASKVLSDRFRNEGASIDTGGDVKIAAERFENVNANFQTQKVTTDSGRQIWHTVPGATERLEPSDVRFYHRSGHEAKSGADYEWALDDDQKGLLLPSSTYPFADYAKYTMNGNAGQIEKVHYRATPRSSNNPFGVKVDADRAGEAGAYRTVPEDMWAKFGVAPPPPPPEPSYIERGEMTVSAPWVGTRKLGSDWYLLNVPSVSEPSERQTGNAMPQRQSCLTSAAELCRPFNQWYGKLTQSYDALNRAVSDYNNDVMSRIAPRWTTYDVNVTSTKDVVIASQPGRITAGRTVDIKASSGVNDKSQILAGGQAYLNDAIQDNSQPKGLETFTASGRAITTWVSGRRFRGDERKLDAKPYVAPMPAREIDLPIASVAPANQAPVKRVLAEALAAQGVSGIGVPGAAATAQARAKLGPIEIRTVQPNVKLPSNALYQVVTDPGSRYLLETDPRFTNRRQWLSSETMMAALGRNPGSVQKRLGDGFYEQQLVQRQIVEATGQRFIGDYTDNQTQYQALMANGVKAAERFQMNVGTALTDAQMAALTDDIVWLVNKEVTLADGTQQAVLVPQVYMRAHAADVTGTGSIVAGESVELRNQGALTNTGTIASRRVTIITADSITNVGTMAGSRVRAKAKQDLHNLGGLIQGDAVSLSAGRDVSLSSTTSFATTANGSVTVIDRVAAIHAGTLAVQAGRDLNADAARIDASGNAWLSAARDVNLNAIRQSREDQVQWDEKNRTARSASIDTGTALTSGGRIGIVAGRDLNATAASVSAQEALGAVAGRDVNLRAGEQSASAYDEHASNERGLLSSKSTHAVDASSYTDAIGTTFSGDTVSIAAGNDLTAEAATIAGTGDVTLQAGHDLRVTTAQTASSEYHYKEVKKSGLGSAGAGISYGTHQTSDSSRDTMKGARGSLIGSTGGSVVLQAGNTLHVTGSDILAAQDVTGIAKEVKVQASGTARHHEETHEMKSSGFTLAVKSPVIDAIQNVNRQARGAAASGDGRAAALHAMAAAGGVADLAGAAGAMGGPLNGNGKPEAKIELSFGASRSKTTFTEDSTRQSGSTVRAGGRAAFIATGEKAAGQGNVTIEGSAVTAGDVLLQATDRVNLLSSTDTDKTRSTNESTSASAGVSFGSSGWGVSAAMSRAKGDANSDAVTHNNTHVQAGNTVTIKSGGDTNIVGATVSAKRVMGDIGGDLNIASEQDTVRSASRQSSVGGGFSVSQGGGSASFSARSGRASGNYAGVGEQSGIAVGDGGFDITVKGNTDLKGAYIASTADPDKNRLRTGTLSFSDVQNSSSYSARSVGISAGGGFGDGGSNYATHGPSSGKNSGGALPLAVSERGSSESLTKSAISAGSITITDEANQKQDIAMLNRDATNLNGIVDQLPDLQAALSNQADLIDAAQAAAEAVAKQVGKYAEKKRDEALTAAKAETDPQLKVQYEQAAQDWAEGGKNRVGLHIAGGALTGGLTGGGLGAVGGAAGAGMSAKLAPKFDALARSIKEAGPTGNANVDQLIGNVTANVLAGGAGALVGGSTGALTSAAADRFNRQLTLDEPQWVSDNAEQFAQRYEEKTGKPLTAEQARDMLLGTGYRMVDEMASKGPGSDTVAASYISENGGDMFRATTAEYKDPFLYSNKDGSLTPEQRALPGAIANPTAGLTVAVGLATGGLAPGMVRGLASIPGAPIFSSRGALGSGALASPVGTGTISAGINAGVQYYQNGSINPVDMTGAFITGAVGSYGGLLWNVGVNIIGGATTTELNNILQGRNDGVIGAGVTSGLFSSVGYGAGKVASNTINSAMKPTINNSINWANSGVWSGSGYNIFMPNNAAAVGATSLGGTTQGGVQSMFNNLQNQRSGR